MSKSDGVAPRKKRVTIGELRNEIQAEKQRTKTAAEEWARFGKCVRDCVGTDLYQEIGALHAQREDARKKREAKMTEIFREGLGRIGIRLVEVGKT